ncbi:hypothetical protein HKW97_24380 (plasmid) [Pseudomonas luteola]|uniref:hypothetical protein n=1 Tax=Pseudomonas luteola TaxID=47886 RepID=UPI00388E550E
MLPDGTVKALGKFKVEYRLSTLTFLAIITSSFSNNLLADQLSFDDFKTKPMYNGVNHEFIETDRASQWNNYRKAAAKQAVNFSGHYVLFTNGCGGGAICGEVIDVQKGKVVASLPNAYQMETADGESFFNIDFKPNSRLLIITGTTADPEHGLQNEPLPYKDRTRYYTFENNIFKLVKIAE